MVEKQKARLLTAWTELRKNLQTYAQRQNLASLETKIRQLVARTQRELKSFDLHIDDSLGFQKSVTKLKNRIAKERAQVEKFLNNFVNKEIRRAKKFVETQKKEISKLQKKIEGLARKGKKTRATKKVARKAGPRATRKTTTKTTAAPRTVVAK